MEHHHHDVAPPHAHRRAFAVGITLNLAFVVVEVIYGGLSHSVALLADAGHNFGDVLGLGLSWGASALATLKPSARRTFGYADELDAFFREKIPAARWSLEFQRRFARLP